MKNQSLIISLTLLTTLSLTNYIQPSHAETVAEAKETTITKPVGDTSANSLDWNGTYKGVMPCASCEGIKTSITLNQDLSFVMSTQYIGKSDEVLEIQGNFKWNEAGNIIALEGIKDAPNQFLVGENRLFQLDMEGNRITGELAEKYILTKETTSGEKSEAIENKAETTAEAETEITEEVIAEAEEEATAEVKTEMTEEATAEVKTEMTEEATAEVKTEMTEEAAAEAETEMTEEATTETETKEESATPDTSENSDTKEVSFIDTRWELTEIMGNPATKAENQREAVFIMFDTENKRVNGFAGCNNFMGSFEMKEGNMISFSPMASTMMACENMEMETTFMQTLQQVDNYAMKDNVLSLNRAKMSPLLKFSAVNEK
ncbi:copper resistance protein NlpE N-terminal domain-containing protein [Geminocystis sp. CENA526]|uniref:copper resistance protein NlpE N-terminal domain-containing protein n=1 Tax=Geminocystis sp. CENA526 TaxID=1355871 RepID=UPI003D6F3DEC